VLDKKQVLAAMDVHIIRAEAEQRRRLERRTSRLTRFYPSLRWAPLEAREDLLAEARRSALRSWPAYALGLILMGAIAGPMLIPDRTIGTGTAFQLAAGILVLVSIPAISLYLRIRSYIDRAVSIRYKDRHNERCARGA
jgi:hypothetical protein